MCTFLKLCQAKTKTTFPKIYIAHLKALQQPSQSETCKLTYSTKAGNLHCTCMKKSHISRIQMIL